MFIDLQCKLIPLNNFLGVDKTTVLKADMSKQQFKASMESSQF